MPRDPLETVRGLRRASLDDAQRSLAAAAAAAAASHHAAREAERAIETEAERASDTAGDDSLVEAFAAWLGGARLRAAQARALHAHDEAEASRRRAELTACRAALEAIEALIDTQRIRTEQIERRRSEREMDEAASRARGILP